MEKNIFAFIWRYSRAQQITIMLMTAASLPFLYLVLDLPKYIINDAIDGKAFPVTLLGFEFSQVQYLLILCVVLLILLVINAVFSMVINTYKGVSSERLIRRLRYQLYGSILRFPPRHFQRVTPPELSAMITAEVEPMADFISDSFSMPMVQGGTMLTILFFMMVEDPILGLVAISMVPVQAWIIPKLQQRVNMLGRERVIRARKLAGWVGESVLGISDIHANNSSAFMQASISKKLGGIFNVRYELYQRKFFMKALNVFLSQLTPLFFYSIGGYLIINGDLSLGALVAVLAAYNRFTTPWKELLKYYQRYNDIKIKYEQLVEQFSPPEMLREDRFAPRPEKLPRLRSTITIDGVRYVDDGIKLLEDVSVTIEPGDRIAVVSEPNSRDKFAHIIARTIDPTNGSVQVGDMNLSGLPEAITGATIGYAGSESFIFSGTVEDNLLLGVKHVPPVSDDKSVVESFDYKEALASGNSVYEIEDGWVDYESLDLENADELRGWVLQVIRAVELDEILARRSLGMGLDPVQKPDLAARIVEARELVVKKINANKETAHLVRPFDFDQYNENATVAANLLFGEPRDDEFAFRTLSSNELVREVLEESDLSERFVEIGHKLSETLIEMFGDMAPDQDQFESFSFVDAEVMQSLKSITAHVNSNGTKGLKQNDADLLTSLAFQLVVDKHRFGFIDDEMQERIVAARKALREKLPEEKSAKIAFFDQVEFNEMLSNRCNLLNGRVNHTISEAEQKTNEIIFEALEQQGIMDQMILHATAYDVGVGGSRLSSSDKQKIALARSLIKKPDILVCNDALSSMDGETKLRIQSNMFELLPNATLIMFFSEMPESSPFGQVLTLRDGKLADGPALVASEEEAVEEDEIDAALAQAEADATTPLILDSEVSSLSKIPLFAKIGHKHLKLLAFNSRRIDFSPGEELIREGEPGRYAWVVLEGETEIVLGAGEKEKIVATYGKDVLLGELSLLSDSLTTATVRAVTPVSALRIEKGVFLKLMESDGRVASKVATWVSEKLVQSTKMQSEAA